MDYYDLLSVYVRPMQAVRTKFTHPYSYDPITLFSSTTKATDSVHTDRMDQWDHTKYQECAAKHLKRVHFDRQTPSDVEAFLRAYMDNDKVVLTGIIEYCNQATGYPTWRLDYTVTK